MEGFQPKRLKFGSPGKSQPGGPRIYVQGLGSGTHRRDGKMKKPSDQRIEGLLPITYGAVRRLGLGHPLRRDPEPVTHTNMRIRNGRSKPDTSTSLRIGHFYFAPTGPRQSVHASDMSVDGYKGLKLYRVRVAGYSVSKIYAHPCV